LELLYRSVREGEGGVEGGISPLSMSFGIVLAELQVRMIIICIALVVASVYPVSSVYTVCSVATEVKEQKEAGIFQPAKCAFYERVKPSAARSASLNVANFAASFSVADVRMDK